MQRLYHIFRAFGPRAFIPTLTGGVFRPIFYKGNISLEKLAQVTSVNGAKIFGFYPRKGSILPDTDADFTICDLDREWTINSDKIYTKCQLNGYHGRRIKGKVTHTVVRGKVIMEEGEVIGQPGYGKFIVPDRH